jgi:hypothetical protein
MTELARPIANANPESVPGQIQTEDSPLPLSGSGPFQIDLKVKHDVPYFANHGGTTWYTSIAWSVSGDANASMTFHFTGHTTIEKLKSKTEGLVFEPVSNNSQKADCSYEEGDYHFKVKYQSSSGADAWVDPVIVVSIPPADGGT